MAKPTQKTFVTGDQHGPVECLGMTFPNDHARREYFLGKLKEKLKDPEFRKIEGFPLAEAEDILTLSDPPFYTACPNPFLEDFITMFGKQYDPRGDNYHREPFAADVSEGRTNPIYTAHTYHTKVPPAAVAAYLFYYTEPGDVVLDAFSGSGMTGVGCALCASKGLADKYNGQAGPRNVILCDLSPAATFISSVYNFPPEGSAFEQASKELLDSANEEVGHLWRIQRGKSNYEVDYQVWAEVFHCPNCQSDIHTEQYGVATATIGAAKEFPCPTCGCLVSKAPAKGSDSLRMERRLKTRFDRALNTAVSEVPRKPLFVYVAKGKGREKLDLTSSESDTLRNLEASNQYWYPVYPAVKGEKFLIKACLQSFGVTHIHHFFLPRQLTTLACLWHHAMNVRNVRLRNSLLYFLTSNTLGMSLMNRYRPDAFSQVNMYMSGVLYLPSTISETAPNYTFKGKRVRLCKAFGELNLLAHCQTMISTQSSTRLGQIPNESIDYVFIDPPFGRNIPYSELNQIWEAWLRVFTQRGSEAIIDQTLNKDVFAYGGMIRQVFGELYRVLKPGRWVTVVFHNSHNAVWYAIQEALMSSGLVVADVRTLDRQMETYKQSRQGIVKQDLVISAYRPKTDLERTVQIRAGSDETAWEFVRNHLEQLPVFICRNGIVQVIAERQGYLLFDRMVAFHVQRGIAVPLSAAEFHAGLTRHFPERDGMYLSPEQASDYDRKRMEAQEVQQLEFFVSDERSAIQWVRTQLAERPRTFQDLQPLYMREGGRVWEKHEQPIELQVILDQNFVKDTKGRWQVPDPKNEAHLEQIRNRALLKEFEQHRESKAKMKVVRKEALRAGFKECWHKGDYEAIIQMAKRVPEAVVQEDPALLMFYDNALTRKGE